jgi:hypothetical protein
MDSATHELPVVERTAARLVVLDAAGCVLLLHVRDLSNPKFGTVWELPGGGIEPGETYTQAALRLDGASPDIDASLRVGNEREDVLGARWWSLPLAVRSSYAAQLRQLFLRALRVGCFLRRCPCSR